MISRKHLLELEAIFLIIVAVIIGFVVMAVKNGTYSSPFNIISGASPTSAPAKIIAPKISLYSQISPDGEKLAMMKVTQNADASRYDFSVADGNGANEKLIFTKTLSSPNNMSLPYNAWSPDDKYFFAQESAGKNKSIFVFKADGSQFFGGEAYLNAVESFEKANTGNNFDEATGWASETLIILNTKRQDGDKGPSYWFEVPSKAVIQLSTDF